MSKRTPGEWDVNEFTDLDGDRHIQVVLKSNGCPLAHMYETGSETRANARAMASATDLIDVLKGVLGIERDASGRIVLYGWHEEVIQAAIAKAEAV